MTLIQLTESMLDTEWTASHPDRTVDVPKPVIATENDDTKERLKTRDVAHVVDGGDYQITPRGFSYTHEDLEGTVTIQLRTADRRGADGLTESGRERLFGNRDGLNPPDTHGGLVGETLRILRKYRKGVAEQDVLLYGPVRDQSDLAGQGYYRADVDVAFLDRASKITV